MDKQDERFRANAIDKCDTWICQLEPLIKNLQNLRKDLESLRSEAGPPEEPTRYELGSRFKSYTGEQVSSLFGGSRWSVLPT